MTVESASIDPDQLSLRPRPQPDADILAVITAAVQMSWPPAAAPDEQDPVHQSWRFSGRWWNKPTPLRRDRPWARR